MLRAAVLEDQLGTMSPLSTRGAGCCSAAGACPPSSWPSSWHGMSSQHDMRPSCKHACTLYLPSSVPSMYHTVPVLLLLLDTEMYREISLHPVKCLSVGLCTLGPAACMEDLCQPANPISIHRHRQGMTLAVHARPYGLGMRPGGGCMLPFPRQAQHSLSRTRSASPASLAAQQHLRQAGLDQQPHSARMSVPNSCCLQASLRLVNMAGTNPTCAPPAGAMHCTAALQAVAAHEGPTTDGVRYT